MVVLAVGNAYLYHPLPPSMEYRRAQVKTAQGSLTGRPISRMRARCRRSMHFVAQVELQARQQQLIAARNNYAKQKLSLARVIGLPPGQEFSLTDTAPYEPLVAMGLDQALQRA